MIYLYINKNSIKLLIFSKTLLGQYKAAHFQKSYESNLLEDGEVKNVDILASAIKEAITLAGPLAKSENQVFLILPQEMFEFARFDIPADMTEKAIVPFLQDKARAELKLDIDDMTYAYLTVKNTTTSKILFFAQNINKYNQLHQIFNLIGLKIHSLVPETVCYFELFKKTLRAVKKEIILYVHVGEKKSFGYMFDSSGLNDPKKCSFTADLEASLKTHIEKWQKDDITVNRIILSGSQSEQFRQDIFTKKTGVWTNPLKKIILNYYQDYLKLIILKSEETFPFLDFDMCIGAFFFASQNQSFVMKGAKRRNTKLALPSFAFSPTVTRRDFAVFAIAFVATFLLIWSYPKISAQLAKGSAIIVPPAPTSTPQPPTPTPTPELDKKTLKIKILNGGGIKGAAADIKSHLQEKGYTEVLVANADRFDVITSTVEVKDSARSTLPIFLEDLKDRIAISEKSAVVLETDDSADIILTIGQDLQ